MCSSWGLSREKPDACAVLHSGSTWMQKVGGVLKLSLIYTNLYDTCSFTCTGYIFSPNTSNRIAVYNFFSKPFRLLSFGLGDSLLNDISGPLMMEHIKKQLADTKKYSQDAAAKLKKTIPKVIIILLQSFYILQ